MLRNPAVVLPVIAASALTPVTAGVSMRETVAPEMEMPVPAAACSGGAAYISADALQRAHASPKPKTPMQFTSLAVAKNAEKCTCSTMLHGPDPLVR